VTRAAEVFGLSRPAFYQARTAFEQDGLWGLIPKKRGPKGAYKLSADVMSWVLHLLHTTPQLETEQLAGHIRTHFGLVVHPRSIERAIERQGKKPKDQS
jgi:transposase